MATGLGHFWSQKMHPGVAPALTNNMYENSLDCCADTEGFAMCGT